MTVEPLLPPFPITTSSVKLLREALHNTLDDEGNPLGGEVTMPRLLMFYSDSVVSDGVPVRYTRDDVIEALLDALEECIL